MATPATIDDLIALRGQLVHDPQGDRVGVLEQIYLDDDTGEPEWIAVRTGRFVLAISVVPVVGALCDPIGCLYVTRSRATIEAAPAVDPHTVLDEQERQRLSAHYYGIDRRATGYVAALDVNDDGEGEKVDRSEIAGMLERT